MTTHAPIVRSLLENDLYKFTMWQALLHSQPAAQAEYRFVCRNTPVFPLAELLPELERELDHLCSLRFEQVKAEGEKLSVVAKGPLVHVMGFEIYVLYFVSELYFRRLCGGTLPPELEQRLATKIELLTAHRGELGTE